jgi:hypothetical protein
MISILWNVAHLPSKSNGLQRNSFVSGGPGDGDSAAGPKRDRGAGV